MTSEYFLKTILISFFTSIYCICTYICVFACGHVCMRYQLSIKILHMYLLNRAAQLWRL